MLGKTVITVFALAVTVSICVSLVELFAPLNKRGEFNSVCRLYLVKMESTNGLTPEDAAALKADLEKVGLTGIVINGTADAKRGAVMELDVQAVYADSGFSGIFVRNDRVTTFRYNKKSLARLVFN